MLSIDFITVGKLKNDPLLDVFGDCKKRLLWKFTLYELEARPTEQLIKINEKLNPNAAIIVMDERGKSCPVVTSRGKIDDWQVAFGNIRL